MGGDGVSETLEIFERCLECRGYLRESDTGDLCAWCEFDRVYTRAGGGWTR